MVTRLSDYVSLRYTDKDGFVKVVTPRDTNYFDVEDVMVRQQQAERENSAAKNSYLGAVASANISLDAGRPYPAPVKPMMKLVSDWGEETTAEFPDLPEVHKLSTATSPLNTSGALQVQTGSSTTSNGNYSATDIVAMLKAQSDLLLAILKTLTTKGTN